MPSRCRGLRGSSRFVACVPQEQVKLNDKEIDRMREASAIMIPVTPVD